MKNFLKLLGIITLAAVIVFSFAACYNAGDDGGGGGGSGGGSGGSSGGSGNSNGWPPANVRSEFDIGGLSQPPGSNFMWGVLNNIGSQGKALSIPFSPTSGTSTFLNNWFTSNGWENTYYGSMSGNIEDYIWDKTSLKAIYMWQSDNTGALVIYLNVY